MRQTLLQLLLPRDRRRDSAHAAAEAAAQWQDEERANARQRLLEQAQQDERDPR
jgi:hypothetical protein